LESQVIDLTDRVHAAEDTVQKLNEQLEELMRAKTQHEVQLVANFVQLLNEKKLKIRTQQRLLASATMDPTKGISHSLDPAWTFSEASYYLLLTNTRPLETSRRDTSSHCESPCNPGRTAVHKTKCS
jgi:hypothetical protein